MGVRAIMKKYDLEYEDRDIINDAAEYAEMVEKSGQPLSPCVEIDGHIFRSYKSFSLRHSAVLHVLQYYCMHAP